MLRILRSAAAARDPDHLGDLGPVVRDHPAAAGRLRHGLHRAGLLERRLGVGSRGGGVARALRDRAAVLPAVCEMDRPDRGRRFRRVDGMEPAGHRGDRRSAVADHPDLVRRPDGHLGAGAADRDLFGGAAIFRRRLPVHFGRLHRPCGAELPARAGDHVSVVPLLRRQCGRAVLLGVRARALELGQGLGPRQAPAAAGRDPGARRHRAADPHHARQPARRAAPALCRHRPRQGPVGTPRS